MPNQNHLERLIEAKSQRLQYLEVQQAKQGLHTPAEILAEIEDTKKELARLHQQREGPWVNAVIPRIFARSEDDEFRKYAKELMLKAHHVVLIGTGLNILQDDPFLEDLIDRAGQGHCKLEIYLADPDSPQLQTRLIEEESGRIKPRIGRTGIFSLIHTLLRYWKDYNYTENIDIKLFSHYPTFALLIIDDKEYFTYPYGYATLGNFSPVLQFSTDIPANKDLVKFFNMQFQHIKQNALNAKMVLEIRSAPEEANIEQLCAFALYFVPSGKLSFYQFGTDVLGYDLRKKKMKDSPWGEQVGGARDFGFHLTLCDALYFFNEAQVKIVQADIAFLAKEFTPFDLTELRLKQAFPDENSLAIVMNDPSGKLEALHHELVQRVYRRAVASNYSLGLAEPTRDPHRDRANLMIKRYQAPYILQRFQPHFTLLTNIQSDDQSRMYQEMEREFSERVRYRTVQVSKLAVMTRPQPDSLWEIKEEIKLG